jgi:hypothetical protein
VNGRSVVVAIRQGRGGEGIIIRDVIRDVLRAQAADRPWAEAQIRLRVACSAFIRYFGPINHTVITTVTDPETGEEREAHRRANLSHFADDPECWLVASIESYDVETGLARKGPIFSERVIAPPVAPRITSATDALAVTLNETGRVDLDYLADLWSATRTPCWPNSARPSSAIRRRRSGRPPTPTFPVQCGPGVPSPPPRPRSIRNTSGTSPRCA